VSEVAPAAPRSAFALLAFAIGVFVVSFPLVVIALRDFGLMLAALTLARLASKYDPPWTRWGAHRGRPSRRSWSIPSAAWRSS